MKGYCKCGAEMDEVQFTQFGKCEKCHEVIFSLECVEAYINGYLGSIKKHRSEDINTIVALKSILNHIKSIKEEIK